MRRRRRIYVASPFAADGPVGFVENMRLVIHASNLLLDREYLPIVPHFSGLLDFFSPRPRQFWLKYGLDLLDVADGLWRLPGDSVGADGEVRAARLRKIPVFFNLREIEANDWTSR